MDKKYSEQIIRHRALTEEGKPCEILERITFESALGADGAPAGTPQEIARRYDLRTGERLNRLGDAEFEDDVTGEKITLQA